MNTSVTMLKPCAGVALLLLCCLIHPVLAQNDNATEEAAIRKSVKELEAGWNAKNAARYASVFAEDADFVVINGMYVKGRAEIEKSHQNIFTTIFKDTNVTLDFKQIRFLRPDVAVVHLTGRRDGPTEELKQGAIVTLVMTKEKDGWKIAAFQNTAAPLR
jgi:uncharacterized protein (TIGR02246 family)